MKCWFAVAAALAGAATAQAAVQTKTVEYKHGDTVMEGFLAYDDAVQGKRPGVLVVHEWMGLGPYAQRRAEQLAAMGYVAFAADIYGKGVRAKTTQEASKLSGQFRNNRQELRGRAEAALDVLRQQPNVDPTKLAAIGYCFGGMTVLELARGGSDLAGVVSFHGALKTPTPATHGSVKCKVLALHGADDPFVPPEEVAAFQKEMRDAGADWEFVSYGNAVHSFTNPDAGEYKVKGAAYEPRADHRSWQAMKDFFDEVFGEKQKGE